MSYRNTFLAIAASTISMFLFCEAIAAEPPLGAPADAFTCYKVSSSKSGICSRGSANEGAACAADAECGGGGICEKNKFAGTEVFLEDAIDTGGLVGHEAAHVKQQCLPAGSDGDAPADALTHLTAYPIKVTKGGPKHSRQTGIGVVNQFGFLRLNTIKAALLLLPSAQSVAGPIDQLDGASHEVDAYKCYKAKISKGDPKFPKGAEAEFSDTFEGVTYSIKKPKKFCAPVDKDGEGIKNPTGHLVCYKAKPAKGQPKHGGRDLVYTNDAFRPGIHKTSKQKEICIPSIVMEAAASDSCDPLNAVECLLPYPTSSYLVADATTETGLRVAVPQVGIPEFPGGSLSAAALSGRDGFNPMVPIVMHFPQGVDIEASGASRLLEPGCCGQPAGPPWVGTRTYDDRSLQIDSPTLLIDAETGEQVLHFVELDARAEGMPDRQGFVMRPGISLKEATRYIVAIRNLVTPGGDPVRAEAPFALLRDEVATTLPAIEDRRAYMETEVFAPLEGFGVDRSELILAFDFTTASQNDLTKQILAMRDAAYDWLDTVNADPAKVPFEITSVDENDCGVPGTIIWRDIEGTFQTPLFLDGPLDNTTVQFLNVDADGIPIQNGFYDQDFFVSIPCSILDPLGPETYTTMGGHGLFLRGNSPTRTVPAIAAQAIQWRYNVVATDWRGLSTQDLLWVVGNVIGNGESHLHDFAALPDRLTQGMLNTLVLTRMTKLGILNRDPTFEDPLGAGVFDPSEEMYYHGVSLGGINGTWLSSLTSDIDAFTVDVPGVNFACMLQRSTQLSAFEALLPSFGLTDPMYILVGYSLIAEMWVDSEPAGYIRHITSDRLPGSGPPPRILMVPAWLDKQVSNQCTEIGARTMGLPNLVDGSLVRGMVDIDDVSGPLDSAFVMYDSGSFDLFNPLHEPFIPPLANTIPSSKCDPHGARPRIPAGIFQVEEFFQPGGQVVNFCSGICDASEPLEIEDGDATPCNPLN